MMRYGASKLKDTMRAYLDEPLPKIEIIKERRFFRETIRIHSKTVPWSKRLYQRRETTQDDSRKHEKGIHGFSSFFLPIIKAFKRTRIYKVHMVREKRKT